MGTWVDSRVRGEMIAISGFLVVVLVLAAGDQHQKQQ